MSRSCYTQSDLIARRSYLTTHCQCCASCGSTGPTGPSGAGTIASIQPTIILDKDTQAGTLGQVLTSTGTGIDWISSYMNNTDGTTLGGISSQSLRTVSVDTGTSLNSLALGGTNANAVNISRSGQTTVVKGRLNVATAIDGDTSQLFIGNNASTVTRVCIGESNAKNVDLVGVVRVGSISSSMSAGSTGQYLRSGGSASNPVWANPTLSTSQGTSLAPNAGCDVPFQLFTDVAIAGTIGEVYLFNFRTNIASTSSTENNEFNITLCTSAGSVTPTVSNSFNVLNPAQDITTTPPTDLTSLAFTRHYSGIGTQARTLNFTYLYQFTATASITFSVWSWANGSANVFTRKNMQFGSIKMTI